MKLFALLYFIVLLIVILFVDNKRKDNFSAWKECIEQSEGTDIECMECDLMYN